MEQYLLYDTAIKEWTASLSPWHAVLYAFCACRRAAPLYYQFVAQEKWGDEEAFKICHRLLETYLFDVVPEMADIERCKARVELFTPSTEEFSDGVYACDTGIMHLYSLSLLELFDAEHAYYIARYCYELGDYAAGLLIQPGGGHITSAIELQIANHPLVQAELSWQSRGRQMISEITRGDVLMAKRFIQFWTSEPIIRKI